MSAGPIYLGVDIGSSKSHALVADAQGQILGAGIGGPGNHESVGVDGFRRTLHGVVEQALAQSDLSAQAIAGAGFGIAGYDWDEDTPMIHAVIREIGFDAPFSAMNDAGPGLLAGARAGWGVSIAAGTGVNARGLGPHGEQARMTGNGWMFAETGGGTELVYRALQDISRAWSLRGPQTTLTDAFVRYAGAKDVEDLLAGITRGRYRVRAAAAPLVFQAAAAGDAVAQAAIDWLGAGLGDLACGIIRQLGIAHLPFDIVLAGSIFQGGDQIVDDMRAVVLPLAPQASFVRLQAPPVSGALLLGMQQAGVDFLPIRERVVDGARLLVARPSSPA